MNNGETDGCAGGSEDFRFKHEDGRVFIEDGDGKGRDPVVGDWLGFDEDVVFVTKQTGPRSFDVIEHPMLLEMHCAMFDGPVETGMVRANKINRDYAATRTPPIHIVVTCRQCGESDGAIEMDEHVDPKRCLRACHLEFERQRLAFSAMRRERDAFKAKAAGADEEVERVTRESRDEAASLRGWLEAAMVHIDPAMLAQHTGCDCWIGEAQAYIARTPPGAMASAPAAPAVE